MITDKFWMIDRFVTVTPGDPFRLFPFGTIYKGGEKHEITPEFAKTIRLPHFKAPLKLGSHDDETPAGGFIVGLEVKDDGLYAIPEWNEAGKKALEDGAYRYHSPEVIWNGALEDPKTGNMMYGPMIIGGALLHTPHLGEATAFYSSEITKTKELDMSEETVQVPKGLWDSLLNLFKPKQDEAPVEPPTPEGVKPEEFKAVTTERDDYKAQLETMKAEQIARQLRSDLSVQLQNKEKFGMVYVELKAADEAAMMMSGMTPEQREWCMRNFSAFIAQIDESKLTGEQGKEHAEPIGEDPKAELNAIVTKYSTDNKVDYNSALEKVKITHADLFKAAYGK